MPSGGARARSGPSPDPKALRRDRNDDSEWITLPSEGRTGDAPDWPLSEPSERELEVWADEWKRPQALQWERNSQFKEVAVYVRSLVAAERPSASTAARTLLLRQMEHLGISIPGLQRNRWRIGVPQAPPQSAVSAPSSGSARSRFKVVPGGAGA